MKTCVLFAIILSCIGLHDGLQHSRLTKETLSPNPMGQGAINTWNIFGVSPWHCEAEDKPFLMQNFSSKLSRNVKNLPDLWEESTSTPDDDAWDVGKGWQVQHDVGYSGNCYEREGAHQKWTATAGKITPHNRLMTIVHQDHEVGPLMCPHAGDDDPVTRQDIEPQSFDVSGTPMAILAPNRNYVLLEPGVPRCREGKCPALIYLHGTAEHAETADLQKAKDEFALVGKWGMLRYAERDPACNKQLGTWMIFPQLLVNESFVHDNQVVFQYFVVPLLNDLSLRYAQMDMDRVSVVGYSEGAVGAVLSALRRPDIFAFAVASSNVLPSWENFSVSELTQETKENSKLRGMVLTYGHLDKVGNISESMEVTMQGIRVAGLDTRLRVHIKVYAQHDHDHWEEVFNRWPSMHDLLWNGYYVPIVDEDYRYHVDYDTTPAENSDNSQVQVEQQQVKEAVSDMEVQNA